MTTVLIFARGSQYKQKEGQFWLFFGLTLEQKSINMYRHRKMITRNVAVGKVKPK